MNLTAFALKRKTLTNFLVLLLMVGGIFSYFKLGRLEDPDFTVKRAVILTAYPGASPTEVELEVTDRIETAIQELPTRCAAKLATSADSSRQGSWIPISVTISASSTDSSSR